jgi:cytochrome c-type biogenesis protein CcmH/NrfG
MLQSDSADVTPWLFLGLTMAAIALLSSSALAYRRSR